VIETTPPGTILNGRYRIERVLGSGGFGHVYLAIDLASSQQYAVKEYLVTGTSGQEQLRHESNVLSQLHHPNLPAFYDAFNERGRYYVVLNYIEGNDLTDLIRLARQHNEAIPIARIMDWLLAICDAVSFLHSQHPPVIHRDIKPDNIRITPDGTAVLVDLGNAKEAADGARTLFFIRHQGTPGYAPLEQYPGGSGTDARSDVYALGGTLYFALTAHEPPSVSTRQSVQVGQPDLPSLQQLLANNPPEDSANPVRAFRLGVTKPGKPVPRHSRHLAQLGTLSPELLERLNVIIQKAMAMKPKNRYQSVAEFAADLRAVRAALPVVASAGRVPDTHSTQPDLPMLYESLQTAKEQAAESSSGGDVAAKPSAFAMFCPRCNAPIIAHATFCPHCGTALTPSSPQNRHYSRGTDVSVAGESKVTNGQARGDIAAEQTLIIGPKPSGGPSSLRTGAAQTNIPPVSQQGANSPSSIMPGQGGISSASAFSAQGQGRAMSSMVQQRQGPPMVADTSDVSGSKIELKWLLIMAVIVAILLVVMIFLLTRVHSGGSGFVGIPRVLLYQLLEGFHGRSFPGRAFTTVADFAAGIW